MAILENRGFASKASVLRYVPGLAYILALYLVGTFLFPDAHGTFLAWGSYRISWIEFLLMAAAIAALADQLRVSHPGIDNTIEAILVAAVAGIQVLLFALGATGVRGLGIFNTSAFLMLTLIGMAQAVAAILVNARTLRRSIGVGDGQ